MRDYKLGVLSAGESRTIDVLGNYVRNIGAGSIKVEAASDKAAVRALSTTIGAGGDRSPADLYNQWIVTNASSVAVSVTVLIGKGEATESEVLIEADVNTLPSVKTDNEYSFMATLEYSATLYPLYAIYNPASSGVNLHVRKVQAYHNSGGTGLVEFSRYNAALDVEITTGIFNKKLYSAAVNKAELWRENGSTVAILGDVFKRLRSVSLQGGNLAGVTTAVTSSGVELKPDSNEPYILSEGESLVCMPNVSGAPSVVSFEWDEVAP